MEDRVESCLALTPLSNRNLAPGGGGAYRWRFASLPGLLWSHGSNARENDFIPGWNRNMEKYVLC